MERNRCYNTADKLRGQMMRIMITSNMHIPIYLPGTVMAKSKQEHI